MSCTRDEKSEVSSSIKTIAFSEHENSIKELNDEIKNLQGTIATLRKEHSQELAMRIAQTQNLQSLKKSHAEEIKTLEKKISNLQTESSIKSTNVKTLSSEVKTLKAEEKKLLSTLATKDRDIDRLNKLTKDYDSLQKANKEQIKDISVLRDDRQEILLRLKKLEKDKDIEIARIKRLLDEKTKIVQRHVDKLRKDTEIFKDLLSRKRLNWFKRRNVTKCREPRIENPFIVNDHMNFFTNKEIQEEEIPVELLCPITLTLMKDPVITSDGHTYERAAISDWLKRNNRSPATNDRLTSKNLISNITLRKFIRQQFPETCKDSSSCGSLASAPRNSFIGVKTGY